MNYFKLIIHLVIILLSIFLCKITRVKKDEIEEDPDQTFKTDNKNLELYRKKIFYCSSILTYSKKYRSIIKIFLKHFFLHKENRSSFLLSSLARCPLFFLAVALLTISLPHNSFALTDQELAQQEDIQAKQCTSPLYKYILIY